MKPEGSLQSESNTGKFGGGMSSVVDNGVGDTVVDTAAVDTVIPLHNCDSNEEVYAVLVVVGLVPFPVAKA
jgi:hypothetical protein